MRNTSLLLSVLLLACGDDDDGGDDFMVTETDSGPEDTDAGSESDSGPSPTNPDDVPAVAIAGDASSCPGDYATNAPEEGLNTDFTASGQNREFYFIPAGDSFSGPRPVFIAFNGTGESGSSFSSRARLVELADRGFVVIAPSSNMNGSVWPIWDDMRMDDDHDRPNVDVDYVDQLLSCIASHYELDENRIYVGGHSAGGIFTNAFVQRRSSLIAGAIAASGIIDLTTPPDNGDLDPFFMIVTWGGDNDNYSGGVGITVPSINFVEQAALASQFYDAEPNVGMTRCYAPDGIGHAWLPINDWFVDRLLEHPKGLPGTDLEEIEAPSDSRFSCSLEPYEYEGGTQIVCPESTANPACTTSCQHAADCGAENATVSPVINAQLQMLGFSGTDCSGCVTQCESTADPSVDDAIMSCMDNAISENMCGSGIAGFTPLTMAINTCCDGQSESPYCQELCRVFLTNALGSMFFPVCATL